MSIEIVLNRNRKIGIAKILGIEALDDIAFILPYDVFAALKQEFSKKEFNGESATALRDSFEQAIPTGVSLCRQYQAGQYADVGAIVERYVLRLNAAKPAQPFPRAALWVGSSSL